MTIAIVILFAWIFALTVHYMTQLNTIAENFEKVQTVIINLLKRERDKNGG